MEEEEEVYKLDDFFKIKLIINGIFQSEVNRGYMKMAKMRRRRMATLTPSVTLNHTKISYQ